MSEENQENQETVEIGEKDIVTCSNCPGAMFTEVVTFVKVPAVASQTGKAGIAPAGNTFICMNCGTDISETEAIKELRGDGDSGLVL